MAKKTTKKAKTDGTEEAEDASPVGDTTRLLRAGTVVYLPGSETALEIQSDVEVTGERIMKDAKFAGMLQRHHGNWELNIDQLEGTWNFATARREDEPPPEEAAAVEA